MNYPQSREILEKIKSSENILLNLHHNPDADSVGSALAMLRAIKSLNKTVKIISSSPVPKNLSFLVNENEVEITDFSKIDFGKYDLFVTLDSSTWNRVSGTHDLEKPDMFFIVIDHHVSTKKFGDINLIEPHASANALIIFKLLQDWDIKLEEALAEPMLAGIMGDTGALRFPEAETDTLETVIELMKHTDKSKIIFNLFQSYEESHINVWREVMDNLKVDKQHKFAFSFIKREVLEKNGKPANAKAEISDMLFQSIEGTDFGLVGAEDDGYMSVSFRSRTGVDVSTLASKLGGGGHKWASAARVWDRDYEKTVEKVLREVREFTGHDK